MSQQDRRLSALPSVFARVAAFVSIVVAGVAGALIGFTLVDLQCEGACDVPNSIGLILGAVIGAFGMGVVAVLVLRATGEWKELEDRK
ncbi:MAG: hypothetical protein ACKOPL_06645 [Acidimicrobiaceae bacterium]